MNLFVGQFFSKKNSTGQRLVELELDVEFVFPSRLVSRAGVLLRTDRISSPPARTTAAGASPWSRLTGGWHASLVTAHRRPARPLLRSSVFDTASAPATVRPSRDSALILLLLRSSFPASILLRYVEYLLLVGR
jgi:hypothetical protein